MGGKCIEMKRQEFIPLKETKMNQNEFRGHKRNVHHAFQSGQEL